MNLMELKKSISEKRMNKLYIFTGEEVAILKIYLQKLSGIFNGTVSHVETLSSVASTLKTNSLIQTGPTMYIIRDDKTVLSTEKIWESLKKGTLQRNNTIVLVYTTIDKRGKFYKEFSDDIVFFEHLSTDVLAKYVAKEVTLTMDRTHYLIDICQHNYSTILLETDKIKCLSKSKNIDNNAAFDMCLKNNAFYIPPEGEIFDLLNAILSQDVNGTYEQLQSFVQRGDSPIAVLSLLHTNLKSILQVQCAHGLPNIGQVTGLNGFQIKNAQKFQNIYTESELIRMIKINRFCEKCIKQTGLIDINMILDFLFVKIF